MNLGRFQLGDFVPLSLNATTATGSPSAPSANPTAAIYDLTASPPSLVDTVQMVICDRYQQTAFFQTLHRLSSSYSATKFYAVCYAWNSGTALIKTEYFSVVAGGDSDGAVIGSIGYHRPDGERVVYLRDGGKLVFSRGPH